MLKIAQFDISENKSKINWKEENKTIMQFDELKFIHRSDAFIHPWDWHNEAWHRYWIGKELFLNKSLRWKSWEMLFKVAFKRKSIYK